MAKKASKKDENYQVQEQIIPAHYAEVVDPVTGEVTMRVIEEVRTRTVEVMDNYVDVKLPKKHRFNNGSFITVFQEAMYKVATCGKLSKNEMQLLLYLIGTCGNQNSINTDLNTLSEELNIAKPNISKALAGLCERNIVIRNNGLRYGKSPLPLNLHLAFDQINYNLAYNGKIKQYGEDKGSHPKLEHQDSDQPLIPPAKTQKQIIAEHTEQAFNEMPISQPQPIKEKEK